MISADYQQLAKRIDDPTTLPDFDAVIALLRQELEVNPRSWGAEFLLGRAESGRSLVSGAPWAVANA